MTTRTHLHHNLITRVDLIRRLSLTNLMDIPQLEKIVLNITSKDLIVEKRKIYLLSLLLETISGQKPIITKAKKSIAAFKLKKNQVLGSKVTLRGPQMYNFLDTFLTCSLPQIKNFKKINLKSVNQNTLTIGISNCLIFPEIEELYEHLYTSNYGINVTFVVSHKNFNALQLLLSNYQLPVQD